MTHNIRLVGDKQRQYAVKCVLDAPTGHVVTIREETRTQEQNRLMWPLIADIQNQVEETKVYAADDMKLRFLNALGKEMRFLPELEGGGMFPVGQRSSLLSKPQFSALIEIIYAWGARHDVQWSRKSMDTINEWRVT